MPLGRRRWRNGDRLGARPRHIHRFLEPCLLLLVHCSEVHGYELVESLKDEKEIDAPDLEPAVRVPATAPKR